MFRLSMLVLIFILTGCATTQFGNFVAHNDEAHNSEIPGHCEVPTLYSRGGREFQNTGAV